MKDLSEFVRYLACQLVDHPDAVQVQLRQGSTMMYELRVDPEDQGRMIGREGRTIQAVRALVSAAARKQGGDATVELAEG